MSSELERKGLWLLLTPESALFWLYWGLGSSLWKRDFLQGPRRQQSRENQAEVTGESMFYIPFVSLLQTSGFHTCENQGRVCESIWLWWTPHRFQGAGCKIRGGTAMTSVVKLMSRLQISLKTSILIIGLSSCPKLVLGSPSPLSFPPPDSSPHISAVALSLWRSHLLKAGPRGSTEKNLRQMALFPAGPEKARL